VAKDGYLVSDKEKDEHPISNKEYPMKKGRAVMNMNVKG
jgi:hypothetical protein